METLSGPRRPAKSGTAEALIVFLHGYGADGNDLIALADVLGGAMPNAAFFAPHAPGFMPMGGREWFPLRQLSQEECARGVDAAAPKLHAALEEELARHNLPGAALALVGFSQGTMMALHVGLRRTVPVAAIVGFSGMLAHPTGVTAPAPVLLVHGTADDVLPAQSTLAAASALSAENVPVEWHMRPGLGHGIDDVGLTMARAHLSHALRGARG